MANYSSGIAAVLARMDTNPSEFFGDAPKWRFIFKENFREVLTEPEKDALHEKLKEVRRQEFDSMVMRTLLDDQMQGRWGEVGPAKSGSIFTNQANTAQNQLLSATQKISGGFLGASK